MRTMSSAGPVPRTCWGCSPLCPDVQPLADRAVTVKDISVPWSSTVPALALCPMWLSPHSKEPLAALEADTWPTAHGIPHHLA